MRPIVVAGVLALAALAAGGCAVESRGKPAVAPIKAVGSTGAPVTGTTMVDGRPAAVAADAYGEVMSVDQYDVVALDVDGRVRWSAALDGAAIGAPVLTVDRVVLAISRTDGSGACIGVDRDTGETRWRYESLVAGAVAAGVAPAVGDKQAFAICVMRDGVTAAIGLEWGFARWEFTFAAGIPASSIEVPDRTMLTIDEATRRFSFAVRVGRQWFTVSGDVDAGRSREFTDLDGPPA